MTALRGVQPDQDYYQTAYLAGISDISRVREFTLNADSKRVNSMIAKDLISPRSQPWTVDRMSNYTTYSRQSGLVGRYVQVSVANSKRGITQVLVVEPVQPTIMDRVTSWINRTRGIKPVGRGHSNFITAGKTGGLMQMYDGIYLD